MTVVFPSLRVDGTPSSKQALPSPVGPQWRTGESKTTNDTLTPSLVRRGWETSTDVKALGKTLAADTEEDGPESTLGRLSLLGHLGEGGSHKTGMSNSSLPPDLPTVRRVGWGLK